MARNKSLLLTIPLTTPSIACSIRYSESYDRPVSQLLGSFSDKLVYALNSMRIDVVLSLSVTGC
jgi:hypothetical protein